MINLFTGISGFGFNAVDSNNSKNNCISSTFKPSLFKSFDKTYFDSGISHGLMHKNIGGKSVKNGINPWLIFIPCLRYPLFIQFAEVPNIACNIGGFCDVISILFIFATHKHSFGI